MRKAGGPSSQQKLNQIKSGNITKKQIGNTNASQKVIQNKGGKYAIIETEKKFEESGVTRKKSNYVMYQSKLATEKQMDLAKLQSAARPRKEEQIVQTKKKVPYLDNYQYHETKDIKDKDPKKISIVTHRRLGNIIEGSYEISTFERKTVTDDGKGKLYSTKTTKTTTKNSALGKPPKTTQIATSKTLPAQSHDYRKEIKKYSSNTNLRKAPTKPAQQIRSQSTTTKTTTKRTQSVGRRH